MSDNTTLRNTDIYLIDQIMKDRYQAGDNILDAGCGTGRNLPWFVENQINIFGLDSNSEQVDHCRTIFPVHTENFRVGKLDTLPYDDQQFDHIVCSAVLHFAENTDHFIAMFGELVRVLRQGGSLFIRMTTDVGLPIPTEEIAHGVYLLKDESIRFLLSRNLLDDLVRKHDLEFLEPFKTTLVKDLRSMATIVLVKR